MVERRSRAELDRLIRGLGRRRKGPEPIPRLPREWSASGECQFPASHAQRRMWLLDRLAPGRPTYNIAGAIELRFRRGNEGLSPSSRLRQALGRLVGRHEVLRTHFVEVDGEPLQVVLEPASVHATLSTIDLEVLGSSIGSSEALDHGLAAEARRPFDLAEGPLLRALWWRLGPHRGVLQLTLHHSVADGWSLGVLLRELARLLADPSPAPELPIHVADHAVWQRQRFEEGRHDEALTALRGRLSGIETLELPYDRRRPARASGRGHRIDFELDEALSNSLAGVARSKGITPFVLFATALGAFLARHGTSTDVAIGFPVAGRRRRELEALVGCFVDTRVLRLDLGGDPAVAELLDRGETATRRAEEQADVPFEVLVEAVAPERSTSSPLFQAMLVYETAGLEPLQADGVELRPRELWTQTAKFDLTLGLRGVPGDGTELQGWWEADADLFDRQTVEHFADRFERLLGGFAAHPDHPLSALPLLRPSELHQLVHERAWGPSAPPPPLLPVLLAERLEREGDAPALVMAGDPLATLSFRQLAEQAASLASQLQATGVGPESVVALLLERSPSLVVSALAVWWAGGAYIPLDLEHPESRQSFTLEDSGARWLIGKGERAEHLAASVEGLVRVDLTPGNPLGGGEQNPSSSDNPAPSPPVRGERAGVRGALGSSTSIGPGLSPHPWPTSGAAQTDFGRGGTGKGNGSGECDVLAPLGPSDIAPGIARGRDSLAYVLYTSGSTGRPKGVEVTHGGLARYVDWAIDAYRADGGTGTLVHSPLGFDLTVTGLWVPLAAGRPVTLISEAEGVEGLERALRAGHDRTLVKLTPSHLEVLRHRIPPEELAGRARALVIGGEALHAETLAPWIEHAPETRLINEYGPTETVVGCCVEVVDPTAGSTEGVVPIGRPIAGAGLWVVDRRLRPVPPGCLGELVIGGDGVARGYRGRPGLTAERFVPDPFSGRPGARLYTSGDQVRSLADGRLTYLGRTDHQVKIRGHRIEPGEIEAAALAVPGVEEAVVVARSHPTGPRLVAYVTGETSSEAVERGLREALPAAWVPSAVLVLDALPRLPNGKFDRRNLPEPSWQAEVTGRAPRTGLEAELLELWVSLLELDDEAASVAGVDSDFFRLGGHSLLATRLLARVRDRWGVEVTLRELFEGPTVAALASWVEQRRGADEGPSALPPLEARPADTPGALTFAQERLWFLHRLDPADPTYNVGIRIDLAGSVDLRALGQALTRVVARHEVLRSHFPEVGGGPALAIVPPAEVPLPVLDLSGLAAAAGQQATGAADRWAGREVRRPFDLGRGPLIRALWIDLGSTEVPGGRLVLTLHHTVSDGWSLGILLGELATFYRATLEGRDVELPALPVQVPDYGIWQRRLLEDASSEMSLDYWRGVLAEVPVLALPLDRPRRSHSPRRGRWREVRLDPRVVEAGSRLALDQGATLFSVLLAGFWTLLARLSGQRDFALGTTLASRRELALEGLVGDFVDTVALRIEATGTASFLDLLALARDRLLEGEAHRRVPFERVLGELDVDRDLSMSPVFQAMLVLLNTPAKTFELPGSEATVHPVSTGTAKFDLTLSLAPTGGSYDAGGSTGGLLGILEFDRDLFDGTTIERWEQSFETLLDGALVEPSLPLGSLPWLGRGERHQLVFEWNGPPLVGAQDGVDRDSVGQRFDRVANRWPDRQALLGADGSVWTYGELSRAAWTLASDLLDRLGQTPEPIVALRVERSPEMVVAMLACQLAGMAYVPLDPTYPEERLRFILEDTAAPVVVTRNGSPSGESPSIPLLLRARPEDGSASGSPLQRRGARGDFSAIPSHPDQLAYLIYTSGSTGRPKGVAISQRNVLAMVDALTPVFSDSEMAGVLAATSINFDLSIFELLGTLVRGGTVILAENALALPEHPARDRVRLINTVPSAMSELVRGGWLPPELGTVNLAGEPLRKVLVDQVHALAPRARVLNLYGPSEDTTYSTWTEVPRGEATEPTVGRPLAGTRAHVVDPEGRPVPVGVAGELLLGGLGVARGYLGRPGLTASCWVPDPLGGDAGQRLYRTGDRVRWNATGELVFLGRFDHQVKVRGHRIELGEVETALLALPTVDEAVVGVVGEGSAASLVAWVAGEGVDPPSGATALETQLATRLPPPLVPTGWVLLDELPKLPNGKVDRAALHRLEVGGTSRAPYVAPRNALETSIAKAFAEVLGRDRVGVEDDFFALGGHSLLATRVVARLRQELGIEVALRRLFELPTVARLSGALDAEGLATTSVPLEPIPRRGLDRAPLSPGQERLWFLDQLDPGRATYNIPLRLTIEGELDSARLAAVLAELERRHEVLRTTFEGEDETPVQVVRPFDPEAVAVPVVDLRALPVARRPDALARGSRSETRRPFDLTRGPVWRALWFRESSTRHSLVLTFHHIVADGASLPVVLRELSASYRGQPLDPLPIQVADHAQWQREQLTKPTAVASLDWWREHLADVPSLELPFDRPRPVVARRRGRTLTVQLPPGSVEALEARCRGQGATLFHGLLAVFGATLARVSNQDEFAIGTPVANRPRVELEGLVGFLVNTLALRVSVPEKESRFAGLVMAVRDELLAVSGHQDVPFEQVVQAVDPERDLSAPPLFQAFLAYQDLRGPAQFPDGLAPGLAWRAESMDLGVAKFDLSLALLRDGDGMRGELELDRDLFDRTTGERLARRFVTLLDAALASPERDVWSLDVLTTAERHQLVWEQMGPELRLPTDTLVDRIGAMARRLPERVAIVAQDGSEWTYDALWAAACDLARELSDRLADPAPTGGEGAVRAPDPGGVQVLSPGHCPGSGAESTSKGEPIVGLCLDRSPELVIAMLATQLAGAAYAPLDPTYPRERLAFILEDTAARVVVTREGLEERLPQSSAVRVLMDISGPHPLTPSPEGGRGGTGSHSPCQPDALAYLIYTSGSTGRPKGVAISHRSALALIDGLAPVFPDLEGVLASTSINFDLSVFELFGTLVRGGTVVLATDVLALPEHPARDRVRLVNTVPSAMAELVRTGVLPDGLKTVNLAGEPLRRALVDGIHAVAPTARVLNLYGPSEDTTYSTWTEARRDSTAEPTIGRPVPGTVAHVVDRRGHPVPLGSVGELVLGGMGLARGYLARPALTAERFVPDGLGGNPGARLYRTGDRVRRRADGELVFLGRFDHQVKVRGFRIELGEIEVALLAQPGVSDAVVLLRGEGSTARLVACAEGEGIDSEVLLDALSSKLPAPLVPSQWVVLATLPRLPNGKVDRRALGHEAERLAGTAATTDFVAPRGELESAIAAIFAEVLGQEQVGVEDDFFALGGHSLLATRVVARLRALTGFEIPLRQLFETPTVARLAASLQTRGGTTLPPPTPRPQRDTWPLTFGQERLWMLDRLAPGPQYNMPLALRLQGSLDPRRLATALATVVERHQGLRAVFPSDGGGPVQRFQSLSQQLSGSSGAAGSPLPTIDLEALPVGRRPRVVTGLLRSQARRSFDLARGPLWRALLLRASATDHHLLVVLHHIVADGVSLGVLADEIATLYGSTGGRVLDPLPIQMGDLALWQREHLDDVALAPDLDFWRRHLDGIEPLDLPTDRPRPAVQRLRGTVVRGYLGAGLGQTVEAFARRAGTTPFLVQLAVFEMLLWRLTGDPEGTLGTPVAGRDGVEVEPLVGFLVNTLVQRFRVDPRQPFDAWLERVGRDFLATWDHRRLPFERLVTALAPDRDLARNPLFQVLFTVQAMPEPRLGDLETTVMNVDTGTARVDLSVVVVPRRDGEIEWVAELDRDLFDPTTVRRFLGTFERLLRAALTSPAAPLETLDPLASAERHQLLVEWGTSREDSHSGEAPLVIEALLDRAAERPAEPALAWDDEVLSYGELLRRASGLAAALEVAGVGPGRVVAAVGERRPTLVVGWLATWLVGAAYLPLDPATPAERLASLLDDCEATAVLVDRVTRRAMSESVEGPVPWLDLEGTEPAAQGSIRGEDRSVPHGVPRNPKVSPNDLAYVLYTSGSTGRPKGVLVSHRTLAALSRWHRRTSDLGWGRRVSQLASPAFDAMVWEVWPALAAGATVVFAPDEAQTSAASLISFFERSRIEVAFVPTPLAELALRRDWPADLPLRRLLTGGDRLRSWPEARHRFELVNHYGPTENTVVATWGRVERGLRPGLPDIGRPLPGVRALVVSRDLRPVPLGAAGELVLGEVEDRGQLARGYLRRPARTAESFVPAPSWLGDSPGARLYRTGDRVRFAADGRIEFLGRLDHQVKVRGVRIELGEVEAALALHPRVTATAAVVVRPGDGATSETRLVAFGTASAGGVVVGEVLRSWLGERLPTALVPQRVVVLDRLPTTRNGKLDRRALEAKARRVLETPDGGTPSAAPNTALEQRLAELVGEVLGVERLGRDANFFEVGASSLSMAEIADRLAETLGRPVAVVDVFRFPTVRSLARHLGDGPEAQTEDAKTLSEADSRAERRRQLGGRRRRRRR